jgi:hypothetical protein
MGIRVGDNQYAIGYIQKFDFTMTRDAKPIYQIEPYPDILGINGEAPGLNKSYSNQVFDQNTPYWPGEAIEVIPGKMGPININLSRYALYTGNLMAAMMNATGGGVYSDTATSPNVAESTAAGNAIQYISILQQVRPFDIYQIYVSPITGLFLWGRKFSGCWFTEVGETIPEASVNEAILENGKIQATYVRPINPPSA